jgi:hypothetical protein
LFRSRSPIVETRRRERRQCPDASGPRAPFTEPKPQQTGTRLLIGHGEVATTSGSTISRMKLWNVGILEYGLSPELDLGVLSHHSIARSPHFFLPGRLTSRTSPFEGDRGGANPSPAANLMRSAKKLYQLSTPNAFGINSAPSTIFHASWCNSSIPGSDPDGPGANPGEATINEISFTRQLIGCLGIDLR